MNIFARKTFPFLHGDLDDPRAFFFHGGETLFEINRHMVLVQQAVQFILRHVRLEDPGFRLSVVFSEPLVEFPGKSADRRLVPDIRPAQAAGGQPADVLAVFRKHGLVPEPRRGAGRGDSAHGAAKDTDLRIDRLGGDSHGKAQ
jgi:hypothetical protein